MSTPTRSEQVSRTVPMLMAAALVGVALCVGLLVAGLLGPVATVVYAVVVVLLLTLAARRGRRLATARRAASGRTCTCCTTSQHDPVELL